MAIKETGLSWPLKSNKLFLNVFLFTEFQILASILIHSISDERKRPRPLTPRLDPIKDFKIVINGNLDRIFFILCKSPINLFFGGGFLCVSSTIVEVQLRGFCDHRVIALLRFFEII